MERWQRVVLGVLAALGGGATLLWVTAPGQYETAIEEGEQLVTDVPKPVVVAVVGLLVVAVFVATMVYLARVLYWSWRQVDRYVLWVVDRVFPESPVVRLGVGLILMVLLFLIGPLVALQALDLFEEQDPVGEAANETDGGNESSGVDTGNGGSEETTAQNTTDGTETGNGSDEGDPPSEREGG